MSNKGAIKKTDTSKDEFKSNVGSKPKSLGPNEDSGGPGKLALKRSKKPQNLEQGEDGGRLSSLTDSLKSNRSILQRSDGPTQKKSVREILASNSRANKSDVKNVPKKTTSSNMRQESIKKLTPGNETKSRSVVKNQTGYSEKRGLSTIYMPRSMASKLGSRSVDQSAWSNSNDKETLRRQNASVGNKTKVVPRERKLSRTLSPSEVKVLRSGITRSGSSQRTDKDKKNLQKSNTNDNYDYEDDFEDYESDFQECTDSDVSQISEESNTGDNNLQLDPIELRAVQRETVKSADRQKNEEEHMLDSGHYELAEARKRAARVELMITNQSKSSSPILELRQPINKSYSEDRPSENKSLPSSTDEGFEDSRSGDFPKSPPLSQISFIDFRKSLQNQSAKKTKKTLSRGEELLEMIKLDVMEWSLLECTPIPYEEFIRSYGKLNAQQTSTQTGEDNIDVETQTDTITSLNKWTQFPITCRKKLQSKEDMRLFRMDQVGVGSDNDTETENIALTPSFDALRLTEFVNRAGTVMLSLLEERRFRGNIFKKEKHQLPFSDGVLNLSVNSVTFLAGRPVTIIHYSEVSNKVLLTIHSPVEEEIETTSKQDYITDCCIGCVWNISEPSMPIKLFYSSCPITACCFHLTNYNVVFAGLQDGSISLWNLKEDEMWHQKVTDKANELDWILRSPTYTTAAGTDVNSHDSAIVAMRIQSKIEGKSTERRNNRFVPIQICSLDEDGSFVVWSVLHNMGIIIDDLGLSYWGDIRLVRNQKMVLKSMGEKKLIKAVAFVDMHVDCIDTNNIYVATNTTKVLHANCIGNKTNPALYSESDASPCGNVTCVEVCPFERSFFLVGCDDGTVRLHSPNVEKPILQLKNEDSWVEIKTVQWSKTKPFSIYTLDNNSRIYIWDLGNSDIHPSHTINMQGRGRINAMQLSSCKIERDMTHQYLALGTESGNVEIHKLKADFCYSKKEFCLQELDTFLRYIAIL